MTVPAGCLECNPEAVSEWLTSKGIDTSQFTLVPEPRHKWNDVIRCEECGACHLVVKARPA